jgi:hypothetical protein
MYRTQDRTRPVFFLSFLLASMFGGLTQAHAGAKECIPLDLLFLRSPDPAGKKYVRVAQICRDGLSKDKDTYVAKSTYCVESSEHKRTDAGFIDWCALNPVSKPANIASYGNGGVQDSPAGGNLYFHLKDIWSRGGCYVLGPNGCTPGIQGADGCSYGAGVSSKFFYTPNCLLEAKVSSDRCWVRAEGKSCLPGTLALSKSSAPVCKRDGVAGDVGAAVYSTDSECKSVLGFVDGGSKAAVRFPEDKVNALKSGKSGILPETVDLTIPKKTSEPSKGSKRSKKGN